MGKQKQKGPAIYAYRCPLEQNNEVIVTLNKQVKQLKDDIEQLNMIIESQRRRIAIQEQKLEG